MAETNKQTNQKRERRRGGLTIGRVLLGIGKGIGTLLLVGITTCAILACFATVYIKTVILPESEVNAGNFALNLSSTIYYNDPQTGQARELRTLHGGENRVWVPYAQIPKNLIHATVAIEDQRFYTHDGVDWKRTAGAFMNMFLGMKDTYGGSTLTQQLIKNITDQDDVTVKRKILEIFRALEFEKDHTKEEILEWYLNYIYLGESSYGVYTAAYTYFGKNVADLTLAECASLIGITNNPSRFDPYISENTRQHNKTRQEVILVEMCDQGYITTSERDRAKAETLQFQRGEDNTRPIAIYTWYEDQVIRDVISGLRTNLGVSKEVATQMVYSGGLSIHSCYNPEAQAIVDSIYGDTENLPYQSKEGQNLQSAITVIDNATGNVMAISGGMGQKTSSLNFNRATQAKRPPGSSIKPLAVYGPALEMGLITPATVIDDSPHSVEGGSPWPVNAVGYYGGMSTVYDALTNSTNTVAVKIMANYLTPEVAYQFVTEQFGLSLEPGRYQNDNFFTDQAVAPLALGGLTDGVSTLEMAAAFSTFPRNGTYIAPRTYSKVIANDGVTVILDNQAKSKIAIKESTAWYITHMLKNAVANGTGRSANFSGMEIAGKTGTTSSRKDLWFAGYTPYYTAVVWTGFDQQERLGSSLNNPSTVMWKKVMSKLHEGLEYKDFTKADSVSLATYPYCKDSGMKPSAACELDPRGSRITSGSFANGDAPGGVCTVHTVTQVCAQSPLLGADGQATGLWHLARSFCPEETQKSIALPDVRREAAATLVRTRDHMYMKSYFDAMGDGAYCTVHTAEPAPEPTPTPIPEPTAPTNVIDPMDPNTWPDPTEYPNFNPFDHTTWPGYTLPSAPITPTHSVAPTEPLVPTTVPELTPELEVTLPPAAEEPFVPAVQQP